MLTGQNPSLNMTLMLALFDHDREGARHSWVTAGYCIDAPEILAAGSMERDQFGPEPDDFLAMPTMVDRVSSNGEVSGCPPHETNKE